MSALPQLHGRPFVTDGGLETDLIFHHGVDLPLFAAFPLLDAPDGPPLLDRYYDGYARIAAKAGAGLLLESPTWRASPDWGRQLGYGAADLARINATAIAQLARLRDRYAGLADPVLIGGTLGPRGDGYTAGDRMTGAEAAAYHRPQLAVFAAAGADLATAYTLTYVEEAAGIAAAARQVGLPVAISFTVETDGRLPSGTTLADAIAAVDQTAPPAYYLVNCAHPVHIAGALATPGSWRDRIVGIRPNASQLSHAELDEATELDEGDPEALAAAYRQLAARLPALTITGGCCGTDSRHVAALWRR
jgi:S-methylmethionine-dependent homocysteine/selenocysteine methylase